MDSISKYLHILQEIRERLSDVLKSEHDDPFLLRFLKARQFDVNKSEIMLRKSLKWRQQIGVDYILANYQVPEIVLNYVPSTFLGFDKEGSSVRLLPQGTVDYKGLLQSIRKLDLVKSLVLTYEYDLRQMRMNNEKTGKSADTFVFILDYNGFSLRQVASKSVMDIVFYLVHVFEANYPERLKKAFLINTPPFFSTIFSAVKPFMAEETREKFIFFGKDGWEEELLKNIDAEVLPEYLGGTRTDSNGDPKCSSIIAPGGLIPQKYYLQNQPRLCENLYAVKIAIEYRSVRHIEIHVANETSLLEWEIETEDVDLGVGLFYLKKIRVSDENQEVYPTEEILPVERLSCYPVSDVGCYVCDKPGMYLLQLDNSYGKFLRKTIVTYRISISPLSTKDEVLTSTYLNQGN